MQVPTRLDKPLYRNLYRDVYEKSSNAIVAITGKVNTGKSWYGTKIGLNFYKKYDIEKNLVYNVKSLIEISFESIRIRSKPFDLEKLKKLSVGEVVVFLKDNIKNIKIKPGRVITFDEAGKGVYIREFFSQDNKTLSKILMMWRFLRLVVIFIVPEDLKFMEKTITRFANYKIVMRGSPKKIGYAKATIYKITGWNLRQDAPYIRRIQGCVGRRGFIRVAPLSEKVASRYEEISRVEKIAAMAELYKGYEKEEKRNKTIDVDEIVKKIEEDPERFIKKIGNRERLPTNKIEAVFGLTNHTARKIKILAEEKLDLLDG